MKYQIGSIPILVALFAFAIAFSNCGPKGKPCVECQKNKESKVPGATPAPETPRLEISKEGELTKYPAELIKDGNVVLPETVITIGAGLFDGKGEIKKVSGPKVTTIKARAFANTTALVEINFPEATTIEDNAFNKASAVTKVELPKVKTIGNFAFAEATSLTEIHLPLIASIGNNAFAGAKALTKMAIGTTAPTMGDEDPFKDTPTEKDLLLPEGYEPTKAEPWAVKYGFRFINGKEIAEVQPAPKGLEAEGRKITKVTDRTALGDQVEIPEYFNEIGDKAFYSRGRSSNLDKVKANGVTRIGNSAFENSFNLRVVEMQNLQHVGATAFKACRYGLTRLNKIPSVIEVGDKAFEYCEYLELVSLPKVQKIGRNIFERCDRMKNRGILHLGATPPTVEGGFGIDHIPTLVVPKGAKSKYDNWPQKSVFGKILEEGEQGTEKWQEQMKK